MRYRFGLGLLGLLLTASACSRTVISVPRMQPAEVNLAGYKRLAVGGIGGTGGDVLATELATALTQSGRFDVLDRQHLQEIIKEQDFNISGRVSDETAISIGQMVGSSTLVTGDTSAYDYNERVEREDSTCMVKGKSVPCVQYTRIATARVAAVIKVLDTETGKVLAAKDLQAQQQQSAQTENREPPPLNVRDVLLSQCRKQVVNDFVAVVAPHEVVVSVALVEDSDLPELKVGNNYALLGKWNEAGAQYSAAIERASNNPDIDAEDRAKALYNLGVSLGYSGNYDAGIEKLEQAFALSPEDEYRGQIEVIRQFKINDARLAEQREGAASATR